MQPLLVALLQHTTCGDNKVHISLDVDILALCINMSSLHSYFFEPLVREREMNLLSVAPLSSCSSPSLRSSQNLLSRPSSVSPMYCVLPAAVVQPAGFVKASRQSNMSYLHTGDCNILFRYIRKLPFSLTAHFSGTCSELETLFHTILEALKESQNLPWSNTSPRSPLITSSVVQMETPTQGSFPVNADILSECLQMSWSA
jgi:hypothetical protein